MRIIIAILLLINSVLAFARTAPGYIIRNSSDTIYGEIRVSIFDLYRGGTVLLGINLEPFHSAAYFREKGENRFHSFTPKDIKEFGFFDKSIDYRFRSFVIESKSIVKSERKRLRFLNLVWQGEVALYRDIVRKDNDYMSGARNDRIVDYYDYYLLDEQHGLTRVSGTKEYKTLKDLLKYYEIDQRFIDQLSPNIRFKDVTEVLLEYEKWKKKNPRNLFTT
jgi:hypothetical protein